LFQQRHNAKITYQQSTPALPSAPQLEESEQSRSIKCDQVALNIMTADFELNA